LSLSLLDFKWFRTVLWVYCVRDTWIHRTKSLISTFILLFSDFKSSSKSFNHVTWFLFLTFDAWNIATLGERNLKLFFQQNALFLPYSMSAEWVWKLTTLLLKIWSLVLYNLVFSFFSVDFIKTTFLCFDCPKIQIHISFLQILSVDKKIYSIISQLSLHKIMKYWPITFLYEAFRWKKVICCKIVLPSAFVMTKRLLSMKGSVLNPFKGFQAK
jgi:hypothetical protein